MKIYKKTGKMAIGSRLRLLTDKITEDAAAVYKLYGADLHPKWFPVFHTLSEGENTITEIAKEIGHSHASVSKIVSEMSKKGVVLEKKDKQDGRRNLITLSKKGKEIVEKVQDQYVDVNNAIEDILNNTQHNLWKAIEEWEYLLNQKSLLRRVQEQKKSRESSNVKIVGYEDKYAEVFKQLNEEWISTYFKMEEADYRSLDHPKEYILDKGGEIFIALYKDEPLGTCALLKMEDPQYDYELAKMAVSPEAQGKNIGWLLGQTAIDRARAKGARSLYLESNTILTPAIRLYHKLGFERVTGRATPYERCNIQMELILK